tara:strand:+ start:2717 stop:3451 length:735 start_codon:yes stop_codon:yes gene_type:complete
MELILLAAGKGSRIYRKIKKNKCLININRKTLIQKIIDDFKKHYHNDKIKIILGYKKKNITNSIKKDKSINFINNKNFASREMLYSLYLGLKKSNSDVIISYTDIYYSENVFKKIKKEKIKQIIMPVYKNWKATWKKRKKDIYDDCETLKYDNKFYCYDIGKKLNISSDAMAQFMGIVYIPKSKINRIINFLKICKKYKKMHTTEFLNFVIEKKVKIKCLPIYSNWYEFDDLDDLKFFKLNESL